MAVGLPPEIVQEYAGRIAERFPRLFLQLGSPSLHSDYNLQTVDGARVKVSETQRCMRVELRLPRRLPCAPQQKPEAQQAQEETENENNMLSPLESSRRQISSNSTNSGAAREESGSDEDMLSPFSKGRRLSRACNFLGAVEELQQMPCLTRPPENVFTRPPYNGTLGERANSTIAKTRGDPAEPQPVAPVQDGAPAPARAPMPGLAAPPAAYAPSPAPTLPLQDWGLAPVRAPVPGSAPAAAAYAPSPAPMLPPQALWPTDGEIKITPSAAGIVRQRPALGGFERMDPGKPVLSRPGSHDPWRSGDCESSQGTQL